MWKSGGATLHGVIWPHHPRPSDTPRIRDTITACAQTPSPHRLCCFLLRTTQPRAVLCSGGGGCCVKPCSPRGASELPTSSQVLRTSFSARKAAGTTKGVCQKDFPPRNLRQVGARRGCSQPSNSKNPITVSDNWPAR